MQFEQGKYLRRLPDAWIVKRDRGVTIFTLSSLDEQLTDRCGQSQWGYLTVVLMWVVCVFYHH
jgi:hypothetical protein